MIYWNLILSKPKKWPPLFLSPDDKALCACARARIRGERRAAPSSMVGVLFLSLPLRLRLACALRLAVVVVKLILSSRGGDRIAFSHFDLVFFDYFHVNKRLCKAPTRCKWKKNLTSFFVSHFLTCSLFIVPKNTRSFRISFCSLFRDSEWLYCRNINPVFIVYLIRRTSLERKINKTKHRWPRIYW